MPKFMLSTVTVAVGLALSGSAQAEDLGPLMKQMQEQINKLQSEVQSLRQGKEQKASDAEMVPATATTPSAAMTPAGKSNATVANNDLIRLSEVPIGYRVIDNENTSVGLYGLIDFTFATQSSGGPNGGGGVDTGAFTNTKNNDKRWTGMDVSWMNGNRWGIAGKHTLDNENGTNLVFKLESEFELPSGNFDGGYGAPILFNRDAWIGVSSKSIGLVSLGRQDSLGRDINMIWANPYSTDKNGYSEGGWMNEQVAYQLMEYSGSPTGNRWDSAAVWKKDWGGLVSFAGVQFAGLQNTSQSDGVYTDQGATTQEAIGLGYNSDNNLWHASGSFTHANYDGYAKRVSSIGGNFRPVSWLRLNGGIYNASIEQPNAIGNRTDHVYTVSAQIYPGGKWDYAIANYHINANNAGINGGGATAQPFELTNTFTTASSGNWDTYYGAAFYRWDKQTDFYVSFVTSKVSDGYISPYFQGHDTWNAFAVGARYFF